MNLGKTTQILRLISVYTKMSPPSEADVLAWHRLPDIQAMDYDRASQAVAAYYQQHKSPMMPVDLIQTVKVLPRQRADGPFYGQPGEVLCSKCRGVHYLHEDCSVLITLEQYGYERFIREFNIGRVNAGSEPWDEQKVRRWLADRGVHMPVGSEERERREAEAMPEVFREVALARTGIDPGDLFKMPDDVELLEGF